MTEHIKKGSRILLISDISNSPPKTFFWRNRDPLSSGVNTLVNQLEQNLAGEYDYLHINMDFESKNGPMFPVRIPTAYPPVELTVFNWKALWETMRDFEPDAIFNVTPEGSIGRIAKWLCHRPGKWNTYDSQKIPYTTAYTTNWDQYWSKWLKDDSYGLIDQPPERFQPFYSLVFKGSNTVLVPTPKYREKLENMGIENSIVWPRGVDPKIFRPRQEGDSNPFEEYNWFRENQMPIYLYHGRVSTVKNIEDFLSLDTLNAHKVIIGDGPHRKRLEQRYNNSIIHFIGPKYGQDLANHLRHADLSVFPSQTDTWGQTITEAGASGVPVVAYDTPGPGEIILPGITGVTVPPGTNLSEAIVDAGKVDRFKCAQVVRELYTWSKTTQILLENLHQIHWK